MAKHETDGQMVVVNGVRVRKEDVERFEARIAKAKAAAKEREKADAALVAEAEKRQEAARAARGEPNAASGGENPSEGENGAPGAAYALLADEDVAAIVAARGLEGVEEGREAGLAALLADDEAKAAASGDGGESGEGEGTGAAGAAPVTTATAKPAPKRGSRASTTK